MFEGVPDDDLLAASVDDAAAFGELYRRHKVVIYRYVVRRIGRREAEDVTVVVFERAFGARSRFDPERGGCLPWLYGIAFNVVSEQARRRPPIPMEASEVELALPAADDDVEAIDARLDAMALGPRLTEGMERLKPRDRVVMELVVLEGLSTTEAAAVLGIARGTAASRLHRARRQMREHLGDH